MGLLVQMEKKAPLRERKRLEMRRRIVAVAVELLCSVGMAEFTLDEVAERANITKPTIYTHFESKDDLMGYVAAALMSRARENFESLDSGLPPEVKLATIAKRLVLYRFGKSGPKLGPESIPPGIFLHPAALEEEKKLFMNLEKIFAELTEKGMAPKGVPVSILAQAWVSLIRDVRYERLLKEGHFSVEELAQAWISLFVRGN